MRLCALAAHRRRRAVDLGKVRRIRATCGGEDPLPCGALALVLVGLYRPLAWRGRLLGRLGGSVEHEDGPVLEVVVDPLGNHQLRHQPLVVGHLAWVLLPEDRALVDIELRLSRQGDRAPFKNVPPGLAERRQAGAHGRDVESVADTGVMGRCESARDGASCGGGGGASERREHGQAARAKVGGAVRAGSD